MKFVGTYILLFSLLIPDTVVRGEEVVPCKVGFFQKLRNFFSFKEVEIKNSFSFAPEQLTGVKDFLAKPDSGIVLVGLNQKLVKFQKAVLARYSKNLNPEVIQAFGTLDGFVMAEGSFSAEVRMLTSDHKLIVEIPNILSKSAGSLGKVSRGLDVGMARFFAVVTKGIEYRLSLNKTIAAVEIIPSKVVNRKLKVMLHELGFEKTSELPDWGEVKGYFEGTGPAAEFRMSATIRRSP